MTNKNVVILLSFAFGGALGGILAAKAVKNKYEQLIDAEVESVKEAFRKKKTKGEEADARPSSEEKASEEVYCVKLANELGYSEQKTPKAKNAPRVIKPSEFGEMDEYDEISLTYYADGTLTDDSDRAMSADEIEETVGKDSLKRFGEYEEDSVFVRNDALKCDYEILADQRTYAQVLREKPYLAG